jgi:prepilin-type N-terminal cleavage/methylation domain-containing protein/prepilin-type processing-associated H-X9-DG protein
MKYLSRNLHSRGFTLVELLVVISILGILTGLLIPAISKGIDASKSAGCTSNLRQLGTAICSYTADQGTLPACFTGILPVVANTSHLPSVLKDYLGLKTGSGTTTNYAEVARCPAVTKAYLPNGATSWKEINSYVVYSDNDMPKGKGLLVIRTVTDANGKPAGVSPFGRASTPPTAPGWNPLWLGESINTAVKDSQGNPPKLSTIPAIYEPNLEANNWPWPVPKKCPHGKNMNVLFFDWHVAKAPADAYSETNSIYK